MPIDKKKKFAFVHIPKCAGTFVEDYFDIKRSENFYGINSIINGLQFSPQHYTYDMINSKVNLSDYFTFSFVRNPYDRVVSEYFWNQKISVGKIKISDKVEDFISWFDQHYSKINSDHKLPQYKFICDSEDNVLVQKLGRVESFEQDFREIVSKIRNEKCEEDFKKDESKTKKFKDLYIQGHVIEKINQIYEKDFQLFDYKMIEP